MGWSAAADYFGFMAGDTHTFLCMGWSAAADCFRFMAGDTHKFLCMGWSAAADYFGFMVSDAGSTSSCVWVGLQLQIVLGSW